MEKKYLSLAILILALVVGATIISQKKGTAESVVKTRVALKIPWFGLGDELVKIGVIDKDRFLDLYPNRAELVEEFFSPESEYLILGSENADIGLNVLWAYGLANKNDILEQGPMNDSRYGGAGGFASTGGWSLAQGPAMDYYSSSLLTVLSAKEQEIVERVSKNIYRPCCDNSTYFPDCNHGMAMLGLLEILAANGAGEEMLYQAAATANRLWFSSAYEVLDQLSIIQGKSLSSEEQVSKKYMSASGFAQVLSVVNPDTLSGSSCSV